MLSGNISISIPKIRKNSLRNREREMKVRRLYESKRITPMTVYLKTKWRWKIELKHEKERACRYAISTTGRQTSSVPSIFTGLGRQRTRLLRRQTAEWKKDELPYVSFLSKSYNIYAFTLSYVYMHTHVMLLLAYVLFILFCVDNLFPDRNRTWIAIFCRHFMVRCWVSVAFHLCFALCFLSSLRFGWLTPHLSYFHFTWFRHFVKFVWLILIIRITRNFKL